MKLANFEDLLVWKKSADLCVEVYRISSSGQFARDAALRNQMRRAAISVMSNIAEGFERYSRTEFKHFLSIARGSVSEIRSQLHLAYRLNYVQEAQFRELHELCLEISRMLAALRSRMPDAK